MFNKAVQTLEAAFANYQGAACARAFWKGRVGLYAVLKALGVRQGDRIGISTFNCLGVVESIIRIGARPLFLDVDRHMNIAPAALERLKTPIKALILQHTFGVPCNLEASLAWAKQKRVPVVEDCCHALGAMWGETKVGSFGVASIYSLQFGKPISAGQGGVVTFMDPALAQEVDEVVARQGVRPRFRRTVSLGVRRRLSHWFSRPMTRRVIEMGSDWVSRRGWFSKPEPSVESMIGQSEGFLQLCSQGQARAGIKALKQYPKILNKRLDNAMWMQRALADEGIQAEPAPHATMPIYWRLPVWVEGKQQILAQARKEHVDIAGWYQTPAHPLRGQALLDLQYAPPPHSVAEAAFASVVTLPTYPRLSALQWEHTIRVLKEGSDAGI